MSRLKSVGRYSVDDQTIGKGNFAVVELATHTVTKTKVALKVIEKRKISKPYVKKNLTREARIMSQLRHPNIVRLYETITSPQLYCLVMEYVPGGDLLTLVRGQQGGRLKEGVARRFIRQLVSALHHMHEQGIVHRDLKMENIMMDKKRENVKIIDFGLSNQCGPDELFKTHCGSPEYAAPELYIAGRDYGPEVDIWSLGVNMFAMVTGKLPFTTPHSENRRQHLLLQIRKGLKGVHDKEMAHLTDDCKDMLHGCIEPVPEDRLPILDIEHHAWITCEGQEPFCPFQAPVQDLKLRAEVIEEMAIRLKVQPEKIQDVVQENKLDDVSAIFNILLEEHLIKQGLWRGDHTRPPTSSESVQTRTGRRDSSRASSTRPGSAYADSIEGVRTPSVVTMVRPSLKSPERMQRDLPPPWAKKTRPLGNATTANRVKARTSYRANTPGTDLPTSDQEYTYAHTDLLHASTIHILVPTPSFESQSPSQADMDDNNQSKDLRARSPTKGSMRNGRKPRDGAGKMQKTLKQITNVRVSFFGSTLEKDGVLQKEQKQALKEKKNPCSDGETTAGAREVNVVDMSNNFTGKHHNYHGYHVEETPITTDDEASETRTKSADAGKDKSRDVRLCVAHREFLQEGQVPPNGRPVATPYSMPRSRDADNELVLSRKLYPPAQETNEHTASSEGVTPPTPLSSKEDSCRYISSSKKKERSTVNSASAGSSSHVISPRSLLHPSIASIHGKKETAAILSNITFIRCSEDNGGPFMRVSKNDSPLKANIQGKKKKRENDATAVSCRSPEQQVCRRTTVQLTDREVRGQKFKMYDEVPQKALQKRPIRRTPDNSPRHSANIQHRGYRSARVSAHVLPAEGAPSKFIQKFGANRMMQGGKDGHRYCRVPKFGLHGNGSFTEEQSGGFWWRHRQVRSASFQSTSQSPETVTSL
ncbi:MAP/microtubule affinity-regulating kinase 4-like isoform X2 [Lytechinus variegatus]|uniref:MAP/microtubule affinity-regulating kinase 4-like isoform X2 n=1 Tax=Lytechinus variegatus TaxID=7654 RepID=UPI001BB23CE7|nr:MAP/microtubule affinity-regulating kinase 4-like isoform X2 [Lytechinus variegatus]